MARALSICAQRLVDLHGLSAKDAEDVLAAVRARANKNRPLMDEQALADKLIEMAQADIDMARRNKLNNERARIIGVLKQKEVKARVEVMTEAGMTPKQAVRGIFFGSSEWAGGAMNSVQTTRDGLSARLLGGLTQWARENGALVKAAQRDPAVNMELTKSLFDANYTGPIGKAAEQIAKAFEGFRVSMNRAGLDIGKLEGGYLPQRHDKAKILTGGFESFRDSLMKNLDLEKSFGDVDDYEPILRRVYDNIIGNKDEFEAIPRRRGKTGSSLEKERVLFFRDAESWVDYSTNFGNGNAWESAMSYLDTNIRKLAVMEHLGPRPEDTLGALVSSLKTTDKAMLEFKSGNSPQAISSRQGPIGTYLKTALGEDLRPDNISAAKVFSTARGFQSLSRLGGATISALADLPLAISRLKTHHGQNIFQATFNTVGDFFRTIPKTEKAELGYMIDAICEGLHADMVSRFDTEAPVGNMIRRLQNSFFKVNMLTQWTDNMKKGFYHGMAANVGYHRGSSLDALPLRFRETLKLYGLDGRWDLIRNHMIRQVGDKHFVIPEMAREVPGLDAAGRTKLETDVAGYLFNEVQHAVITPDDSVRAYLHQGTNPGTVSGELLRSITQFKSFPLLFMTKVAAPIWKSRKVSGIGTTGMLADAAFVFMSTTLFGGVAMEVKRLTKGKKPLSTGKNPDWPAITTAAILQGGGLGIFGDFFLADTSRFGGTALETAAGPLAGTVAEGINIVNKTRASVTGDDKSTAADYFKFAKDNTPFANLWYAQLALNTAILWDVEERLKPGTMARRERQAKKRGEEYWLSPTRDRLRPLTD